MFLCVSLVSLCTQKKRFDMYMPNGYSSPLKLADRALVLPIPKLVGVLDVRC